MGEKKDDKSGFAERLDRHLRGIQHSVQRLNKLAVRSQRPDRENYLNGDAEFLFEYAGRRDEVSKNCLNGGLQIPDLISEIHCKANRTRTAHGIVQGLCSEDVGGKLSVISRWDQQPMLVRDIEIMDQIEEFIPSSLTVGRKLQEALDEPFPGLWGQSVLYGFLKPCSSFAKGELKLANISGGTAFRGDDLEVSMVESGPEIMNRVSTDQGAFVRDGFVLFGERGAVAGVCIRLKDIGEWSLIADHLAQLADVFRGPLDFEECRFKHHWPRRNQV